MDDLALGRLANQLPEGRLDHLGRLLNDLPLGRGRQRDPDTSLQLVEPVKRNTAAVFPQRDHTRPGFVILLWPPPRGSLGSKHLAAEVAPELLQFVDGRRQGCLPHDSYQVARRVVVHFALLTFWTAIARLE